MSITRNKLGLAPKGTQIFQRPDASGVKIVSTPDARGQSHLMLHAAWRVTIRNDAEVCCISPALSVERWLVPKEAARS